MCPQATAICNCHGRGLRCLRLQPAWEDLPAPHGVGATSYQASAAPPTVRVQIFLAGLLMQHHPWYAKKASKCTYVFTNPRKPPKKVRMCVFWPADAKLASAPFTCLCECRCGAAKHLPPQPPITTRSRRSWHRRRSRARRQGVRRASTRSCPRRSAPSCSRTGSRSTASGCAPRLASFSLSFRETELPCRAKRLLNAWRHFCFCHLHGRACNKFYHHVKVNQL